MYIFINNKQNNQNRTASFRIISDIYIISFSSHCIIIPPRVWIISSRMDRDTSTHINFWVYIYSVCVVSFNTEQPSIRVRTNIFILLLLSPHLKRNAIKSRTRKHYIWSQLTTTIDRVGQSGWAGRMGYIYSIFSTAFSPPLHRSWRAFYMAPIIDIEGRLNYTLSLSISLSISYRIIFNIDFLLLHTPQTCDCN